MKSKTILFLMVFLTIFSCSSKKNNIEIGAILPLTGGSAIWGKNTKMGIDLAVEEINKKGGINGHNLIIKYEDTKGEPKNGVSAIKKLISIDRIRLIIDDSNSSVTLAVAPIVEKNKVILLVTGASSPKITYAGDFVFRIWNSDALQGSAISNYAYDHLNIRKVAILYINNDYGLGLKNEFVKNFKNKSGEVLYTEGFAPGTTDFRTILSKINKIKPDGVFVVAYPEETPVILKQFKELNYKGILLLNGDVIEDNSTFENVKNYAEGIYYATNAPADTSSKIVKKFRVKYLKKYGIKPGITSPEGYDAVYILFDAITRSKKLDSNQIKNNLYNIKNFKGASGIISFDKNGEVHKPLVIKKVEQGSRKIIKFVNFN